MGSCIWYDLDKLLQEKFTSVFRSGYKQYGKFTMPERFDDLREDIENFEVFDDDVWVCSFPKTGTTWTQEMVWLLSKQFDYKEAEENLGSRFPFLEVSAVFDFRKLKKENEDFVPPPFLADSIKFTTEASRPRFIKTHLPWSLLPKQIREFERRPKIIYVTRDARDTCISYFHHGQLLEGFTGSFEEYCELFIGGKVTFGPFWENVLSYWSHRYEPNLKFLKYEDMRNNLRRVVIDTARFLGTTVEDQDMEKLLKHLSFDAMKANPAVNYEPVLEFHRKFNLTTIEGVFMRSGKEKSHKAAMSDKLIDRFDTWTDENARVFELN